jgi:hypothetical protein
MFMILLYLESDMPLIKQDEQPDKVIIKAKIDRATKESADNYCQWANISDIGSE